MTIFENFGLTLFLGVGLFSPCPNLGKMPSKKMPHNFFVLFTTKTCILSQKIAFNRNAHGITIATTLTPT